MLVNTWFFIFLNITPLKYIKLIHNFLAITFILKLTRFDISISSVLELTNVLRIKNLSLHLASTGGSSLWACNMTNWHSLLNIINHPISYFESISNFQKLLTLNINRTIGRNYIRIGTNAVYLGGCSLDLESNGLIVRILDSNALFNNTCQRSFFYLFLKRYKFFNTNYPR